MMVWGFDRHQSGRVSAFDVEKKECLAPWDNWQLITHVAITAKNENRQAVRTNDLCSPVGSRDTVGRSLPCEAPPLHRPLVAFANAAKKRKRGKGAL